jgi:hypothetical protein
MRVILLSTRYLIKTVMQLACMIIVIEGVLALYDFTMIIIGLVLFAIVECLYRYDRKTFINREEYK